MNAATATAYNFILARRTSARVSKWRKAKKSRGFRAVSTHNPCIKDNVLIDPAVDPKESIESLDREADREIEKLIERIYLLAKEE